MPKPTFRRTNLNRLLCLSVLLSLFLTGCGLAMNNEDRLNRAEESIGQGDYRAAIIDAKDVLRKEPDNVRGRLLLAKASIATNDGAAAEKEFQRAIELGTPRNEVIVSLARALLQQNKHQQIVDNISVDSTMSDEVIVRISQIRADAFLGLGQSEVSRDLYLSVLAVEPDNVDAKLGVVSGYVAEKNYIQARATLDEIITTHPDVIRVWLVSGALNLRLRAYDRAEANFQAALTRAEQQGDVASEAQALAGFAEALLAQEEISTAREYIDRLLVLAPNSLQAVIMQARIAYIDSDWAKAQQNLQQVLLVSPNNNTAQMLLGAVQLRSGNLSQAEMYLSAVVARVPENREARRMLAETRLQMQRVNAAQETLQPLISGGSTDVRSLSMAARASSGQGNYDEAIRYLEQSLSAAPGNTDLQFQLVSTYLGAGRIDDAERTLKAMSTDGSEENAFRKDALLVLTALREGNKIAALESARLIADKYSHMPSAFNLLGSVELQLGNNIAGRSAFVDSLSLEPDNLHARRLLSSLDELEGDLQTAETGYREILQLEPDAVWAMYSLARVAARNRDTAGSRNWLEKIREIDSRAVNSRLLLSRLVIETDEHDLAAEILDEVLQQDEANAEAHNLLGLSKIKQKEFQGAVNSLRRATELNSENTQYRLNLALAQKLNGDMTLAMQTLDRGPMTGSTNVASSVMLASLKVDEGDLAGAMDIAKRLQDLHSDSAVPYALEAEIHARSGNLIDASDAYDQALSVEMISSHVIRAFQVRNSLGQGDAETPLLQLLAERPLDNEIRMILASYLGAKNQIRESIVEYEEIIANDPTNFVALNNLSWSYQQVGDGRAEMTARRAYELTPDNASAMDTLGWILVEKGSLEEGEELLRRAVRASDGRSEVKYHLAAALSESGNVDEARTILREILGSEQEFSSRSDAEKMLDEL